MEANKINTLQPIYNGYSIRYILGNLPKNMIKYHRKMYIDNCIEVYKCELHNIDINYSKALRNSNITIIEFYNKVLKN